MAKFDAASEKENVILWIRSFFDENGHGCNAVIGISGGKDSSVCAALCAEALGKDRVVGVLMPNGEQTDLDTALLLVKHLDIPYLIVNIEDIYNAAKEAVRKAERCCAPFELSTQTLINLAPRLRMTVLYAVSQSINGRVSNNSNKSEQWVGYSTRYGDMAGDFAPLSSFTVQEVKAIGRACGLPEVLIEKVPSDGLCGKSDEDNLGFSYAVLDKYLRTGEIECKETKALIDRKHASNKFKLKPIPFYDSRLPVKAKD